MTIYKTKEWKGFGKQSYYWNEYRREGDRVVKYKCHRGKFFDGKENEWYTEETKVGSWKIGALNMPKWLNSYL